MDGRIRINPEYVVYFKPKNGQVKIGLPDDNFVMVVGSLEEVNRKLTKEDNDG